MEYKIKVDEKDHAFRGKQKMNIFRKEGRFCDFIIKVESEEFPVHQNVISSHSDFFDKMLTHDTQEKQTGVVEIKGVGRECTVKCVDFMYTGETSIVEDKCVDLMHAATMFQLTPLCDAIADLLVKNLDPKSFYATKSLADLFNNQKLVDICKEFALKHFQEITQLEEFGKLDEEYIMFVMCQATKVPEGTKCKALINWAKYDPTERKASLPGLMSMLDLTKIPLSYRSYITECEPLVNSSSECMKLVTMSVFQGMNVKSKDLPDGGSKNGICVFDNTSQRLQVLDVDDGTWTPKQAFDTISNTFSTTVLDEHLYVFSSNNMVHRIAQSDPDAKWERRANKQSHPGSSVVLNGFIYTSDYGYQSQRIERYDPSTDKWSFLPNKQLNVHTAPLAISGGKIFCIAGCDINGQYRREVEVYDLATSTWKYDNPLNRGRYNATATTHEEGIYVLGGNIPHVETSDVEYRCPSSKLWTTLKSMNNPSYYFIFNKKDVLHLLTIPKQ